MDNAGLRRGATGLGTFGGLGVAWEAPVSFRMFLALVWGCIEDQWWIYTVNIYIYVYLHHTNLSLSLSIYIYILYIMFIFPELPWPPSAKPKNPPPKNLHATCHVPYPYPPTGYRTYSLRGVNLACRDVDGQELSKAPFCSQKKMGEVTLGWNHDEMKRYISVNSYIDI